MVRFLEWCDARGLELREVSPGDAARFIEELAPSVANQKIALDGKTPEISPTQARRLLESVDCSRPVGDPPNVAKAAEEAGVDQGLCKQEVVGSIPDRLHFGHLRDQRSIG